MWFYLLSFFVCRQLNNQFWFDYYLNYEQKPETNLEVLVSEDIQGIREN